MDVRVGLWRKLSTEELMPLNCGFGEDSWESLGLQGDPTSPFWRRLALGFLWRAQCWSWNSSTLATSCEELTHWKRLWCWEGLGAGGQGDNRGWDGWMASLTWWIWVWTPGVGDGQGGLACCNSWGRKESDTTEWLNWIWHYTYISHLAYPFIFWWMGLSYCEKCCEHWYNSAASFSRYIKKKQEEKKEKERKSII